VEIRPFTIQVQLIISQDVIESSFRQIFIFFVASSNDFVTFKIAATNNGTLARKNG
jgi:hypothetical protein